MSKKIIAVHNGGFHADDVFSVATLMIAIEKGIIPGFKSGEVEVRRTRDEGELSSADIVLDVGGVYDEVKNRFDHHQPGGAGERKNAIPYASFGLIWRKFGRALAGTPEAAQYIDRRLVQSIDATDNGVNISNPQIKDVYPYTASDTVFASNPTWKEGKDVADDYFMKAVELAKTIIMREIIFAQDFITAGVEVVKAYQSAEDKRVVVLSDHFPFQEFLAKFPEPLYAVSPQKASTTWHVSAVMTNFHEFKIKKPFPESWAGKRDEELQKETGVSDAVFCHNKRFLAVAKSKDGALKLAQLALTS